MDSQSIQTEMIRVFSPIDGREIGAVKKTAVADLPRIFKTSRAAQATWAELSVGDRVNRLRPIVEKILDQKDLLADLIHRENGKPKMEAFSHDLLPSIMLANYFLEAAPRVLRPRKIRISNPILLNRTSRILHQPLGAIAVISPWNFPFYLPFGEVWMALLAGNSVILKPSEITPLIAQEIQRLFEGAQLPVGLVQTVFGDGQLGSAIIEQKPEKIFFTGSVATGKAIAKAAADNLIPCNLELGGKNPIVILPDADLDHASSAVTWGIACNGGQACSAASRVFVHESIAKDFCARLVAKLKALRVGPMGEVSMITLKRQGARYQKQIENALKMGATILTGGAFVPGDRQFQPTAVWIPGSDLDSISICTEETFGPVVSISPFHTEEEAVRRANQSHYGLVASILTGDAKKGSRLAEKISAGSVMINEVVYSIAIPEAPWGGPRLSGGGLKHSDEGLLHFTRPHHIHDQRLRRFKFKSFWWYPYSDRQLSVFNGYMDLYRQGFMRKLIGLIKLLPNALAFLLREPRR